MTKLGYARSNTYYRDLTSQLVAIRKENVTKIFIEKDHTSNSSQSELEKTLRKLQDGDTLVIYSLDRLNRNIKQLLRFFSLLAKRNIHFISISEKIDTTTMGENMIIKVLETLSDLNIILKK